MLIRLEGETHSVAFSEPFGVWNKNSIIRYGHLLQDKLYPRSQDGPLSLLLLCLRCVGRNLNKLTGFEKLPQDLISTLFQILDENNQLSDLAFEKLLSPTTTQLKFNKLSRPISPNAAKFIARCQQLEKFSASILMATDEFLNTITSECRNIKVLDLSDCYRLRQSSLCTLINLNNLRELNLSGVPAATSAVIQKILENCNKLQTLDLSNANGFDDTAFAVRKKIPLKKLIFANCTQISDALLKFISKNFESLESLALSNCSLLSAEGFRMLEVCTSMQHLNLQLCGLLNDSSLLNMLKSMTLLQSLNIGGCQALQSSNLVLWQAHSHLQRLRKLKICGMDISHGELKSLLTFCSSLQVLDLAGCQRLKQDETATQSILRTFSLQKVRMPSEICEIRVVSRATQNSPFEVAWKGAPVAEVMAGILSLVADGQSTPLQPVHSNLSPSGTFAFCTNETTIGSYQVCLFDHIGNVVARSNTMEIEPDEEVWLSVSPLALSVSSSAPITVRWQVKEATARDWIACYSGQYANSLNHLNHPIYQYNSAATLNGSLTVPYALFYLLSVTLRLQFDNPGAPGTYHFKYLSNAVTEIFSCC